MFTPGRAGGRDVLVWEGLAAAPDSPLAWHSTSPVVVFFHTGHGEGTRALPQEFTRQLDRQLCALSLLSADKLLEGIRTYRAQGRQPMSDATKKECKRFLDKVTVELIHEHGFNEEKAKKEVAKINDALVMLHESDQLTYGPSQPGKTVPGGYLSLGHGRVNSSIGRQGLPLAKALEAAVETIPVERRGQVRILVRAVLTDDPELARNLRCGRVPLEPRSSEQMRATSPRAPPWTPAKIAADIKKHRKPWQSSALVQAGRSEPSRSTGEDVSSAKPVPSATRPLDRTDLSRVVGNGISRGRSVLRPSLTSTALCGPPSGTGAARGFTPADVRAAIERGATRIRRDAQETRGAGARSRPNRRDSGRSL
ncbi:polymorphic toxin type 15 domain-containing protein [Actinomyces ruminis]